MAEQNDLMDKIVSLCKRRGFIFPGSEIYGGLANSWDYGPLGVELKNNIQQLWWKRFVQNRGDMVGIDAALMMNPKVWEASGHLSEFNDPMVECRNCHGRFRDDQLIAEFLSKKENQGIAASANEIRPKIPCPTCGKKDWTEVKQFNMMFRTNFGPIQSLESTVYFRPEIAQSMFVNFKNVLDTMRKRLPFGIASQGKAFRNEITPGNFIFRTREFNLMEFEYFIRPEEWEQWFEYWRKEMHDWLSDLGVNPAHVHELEVGDGDRAHYSKRTVDFEYDYPFGRKELYGLAYRTDFDLSNHMKVSGQDLRYTDPESGEKFVPHVIEPTFGLDRSILITLLEAYREEEDRVYLSLPPKLAPYKVAVFPLLKNKPELVAKAREIYNELRKSFAVAWDDRGNVGKRYYSQDEIGTPFCITVDFQSLEDGMVTIRNRDTKDQPRVKIEELVAYIGEKL